MGVNAREDAAAVPPPDSLFKEVTIQARTALPISAVYLLQFLAMLVSQAVAGHVSADSLAAVALATFWINVCCNAPLVGLAFASDSLLPQAIGAGNFARAGHIAQRGALALLFMSALILPLLLVAGPVFAVLHQQPAVTDIASSYVRWLAIGLPAMALFEVYKKLVNACGIFAPPLILAASALAVQGGLAYGLVYGGWNAAVGLTGGGGMDGAAVAFVISLWWCALGGALHLATHRAWLWRCGQRMSSPSASGRCCRCCNSGARRRRHHSAADEDDDEDETDDDEDGELAAAAAVRKPASKSAVGVADDAKSPFLAAAPLVGAKQIATRAGGSAEIDVSAMDAHDKLDAALAAPLSLSALLDRAGWVEYLSAGLPAVIMMVLEWGSFEALAVIAGTIDAQTQAAHAVLGTLEFLAFAPLLGFALGISLRAGTYMGARNAPAAVRATRATFLVVAVYTVVVIIIIGSCHAAIVPLFTSDGPTGDLISHWSPVLCGVFVFDALQGTSGGVLRGIGRPVVGALSSVVSYLFVGLPLSYVLAKVVGWGLPGLWAGIGASVFVAFSIMGGTLARMDWQAAADAVADAAEVEASATGTAHDASDALKADVKAQKRYGSAGVGMNGRPSDTA